MGGLRWPELCLMICAVFLFASAQTMCAADPSPTTKPADATVWTLDNVKSIGGQTPEVFGSPQIVTSPAGPALQFDGAKDGLLFSTNPLNGWAQFTIEVLIKPQSGGPKEQRFLHVEDEDDLRGTVELRMFDKAWALDTFLLCGDSRCALLDPKKLHPADRWTWVALVYQNGKMTSYIDGAKELEGAVDMSPMGDGKISLGVRQNKVSWYKGVMRQVIFHPTALSPDALQRATQP